MSMPIREPADLRRSDVTPRPVYLNRRKFLAAAPAAFLTARESLSPRGRALAATRLNNVSKSPFSTSEQMTPPDVATRAGCCWCFRPIADCAAVTTAG